MKVKIKSTRRGVRVRGEATGSEVLIYPEAECVKQGCDATLLSFSYARRKKGYQFEYHAGTGRPLREMLSAPIPREYFEPMLISFLDLARVCDMNGLSMQRVSFDVDHVLFDPAKYSLRFVYMPVRGATERVSSPLEALEKLARNACFDDAHAQELAHRVLDYVLRSAIFSWTDYESFLRLQGVLEIEEGGRRDTSLLDGRVAVPADCRDRHGFDFMSHASEHSRPESQPKPAHELPAHAAITAHVLRRALDGYEWPLKAGSNLIGTSKGCDIRLAGIEGVSRQHAALQVSDNGIKIMDMNSTNGVTVNGRRIPAGVPVVLQKGDRIHIAHALFTVRYCRQIAPSEEQVQVQPHLPTSSATIHPDGLSEGMNHAHTRRTASYHQIRRCSDRSRRGAAQEAFTRCSLEHQAWR